ncbi:glycoside hydrolase [Pokkaliibacter plantistimulans]|uniref:Glycoside hydrolase n=1 Tax=Proteobacteria bacterium 228 TaxID=2083153 RepID=A0A2S5KTA0_9PROT|nr:glycosyl hydrolase [Pokkaliibacter plantistimulans]PPC77970.1 glycoside hydrolase [Pokkaliibacter plantistimulans]
MPIKRTALSLALATAMTGVAAVASAQAADAMQQDFLNPPHAARPLTWWHWLNGNISEEGIRKDLAWMQQIGLGGVQNFNADMGAPPVVAKPVAFMSPEWQSAFHLAVSQARSAKLDFAVAASAGWSETGGPWVGPEDGMKKLVWRDTTLQGGQRLAGPLTAAADTTGPYQNIAFFDPLQGAEQGGQPRPRYYHDVAVLAYPLMSVALPAPRASLNWGNSREAIEAHALLDADFNSAVALVPNKDGQLPAVEYEFAQPVTVRSATLFIAHARPPFGEPKYLPVLQADEGAGWHDVASLPLSEVATTVSFAPVTAARFRLLIQANPAKPVMLGGAAPGAQFVDIFGSGKGGLTLGNWTLSAETRINQAEIKAGFAITNDFTALASHEASDPVAADQVINLTDRLQADGTLDWQAPAGRDWRIVRYGYSLTGKTNHPASPEATGLEVDKYDAAAVSRYLQTYLKHYRQAAGEGQMGEQGLNALVTDSIEVGASNWTPRMIEQFSALRGYDPTPWLPVLSGTVIGSTAQSEAFLYDFRHTLADLLSSQHYQTVAAIAHQQHLKLYGEALENGRPVLGDDMDMRAFTDFPMAAMWSFDKTSGPTPTSIGDVKGAASVAHLYGQNIVAAESMTSMFAPWAFAPADLKPVIDAELLYGINRPIIHTSVHQPTDDLQPGLALAVFGQYFNRHETWAQMARPWIDYIARSSYMMQRGRDVADVAYFYGEDQPLTALFRDAVPTDLPVHYGYDFINSTALQQQVSMQGDELVARGGARYRVLYLGGRQHRMSLKTLQRIHELVEQGLTVIGTAPARMPSLSDDPQVFADLVRQMWGEGSTTRVGRGQIIASPALEPQLARLGVIADFSYSSTDQDTQVMFAHRQDGNKDIYFLVNRKATPATIDARFRGTGRVPTLWHAVDGSTQEVSYRQEQGSTLLPLTLAANDAVFVVFDHASDTASAKNVVVKAKAPLLELQGPWQVSFQSGRGAPAAITLTTLQPLNSHADEGVRYFSGISTYTTHFATPTSWTRGQPLWLELGKVGDVAEVRINGQEAGISWLPPYQLELGQWLKPGDNQLEVRVANLWVNRLIGDKQSGAKPVAFAPVPTYQADAPLRPSGLIGPVRLLSESPQ